MMKDFNVDSNNMYHLIIAVYMDYSIRGKQCPYDNLLSQVDTYKMNGTPFRPKLHKIDDFMVDAYKIYDRYLNIENDISAVLSMSVFGKMFNEEKIRKEFTTISNTFEELIMNCDFEGVQIRGIQKNLLIDKLKNAIDNEEYELCSKLKNKIDKL